MKIRLVNFSGNSVRGISVDDFTEKEVQELIRDDVIAVDFSKFPEKPQEKARIEIKKTSLSKNRAELTADDFEWQIGNTNYEYWLRRENAELISIIRNDLLEELKVEIKKQLTKRADGG